MHRIRHAGLLTAILAVVILTAIPVVVSQAQSNPLGVDMPSAARLALSPAEQVEAVCATTRWRALEIRAALDAVETHRPAAAAALANAGVDFELADPAPYRAQAEEALGEVCSAPTLEVANAGISRLLLIHQDMEASYGAVEEAMRPYVDEKVAALTADIRPQIEAWAEEQIALVRAKMDAEGQAIADSIVAAERPLLEAQLQAEAETLARSGALEAEVRAQIESRAAAIEAQARVELTSRVEAALAGRIAEERARIEAEANTLRQELAGAEEAKLRALEEPFNRLKQAVADAVEAARRADSPERQTAIETRVRLALKVADANLAPARDLIERARTELAALKASNPAMRDADELLTLMTTERARLEERLRSSLAAGDEVGFTAATIAFQQTWQEIKADMDAAAGTWSSAQVCAEALPSIERVIPQVESALASVREGLAGDLPQGNEGTRLVTSLRGAESDLQGYLADLQQMRTRCGSPASVEPRALIVSLDTLRVRGEETRLAINEVRELAESLAEGTR